MSAWLLHKTMKYWISTLRLIHHQTLPRQIKTAPEEEQKPKESSSGISYLRSFYSSSYYPDSKSAGSYFRADVTAHKAKIKISPPSLPPLFTSCSLLSPPPALHPSLLPLHSLFSPSSTIHLSSPLPLPHRLQVLRLTHMGHAWLRMIILYMNTHTYAHTHVHTHTHTHIHTHTR